MAIQVVLADDHTLFREMLRAVLTCKREDHVIVGEAGDGAETLELVTRHHPDLLLLDYKMPGLGRLSAFCQEVTRQSSATRTLIVSGYAEEEVVLEAAVGGAKGYLLKGASLVDLFSALVTVHAGGTWVDPHLPTQVFRAFLCQGREGADHLGKLSRQELTILSLVAQGMSNREIGARLGISKETVRNHLTHVFAKLRVAGRPQAILHFLTQEKSAQRGL